MAGAEAQTERFGKYHVLGRLAQGGMAEIYKVKTVGLAGFEKLQVLKRILPAHAQNPRFIRSFIDEARIAVSLNHRNIVQVFEFGRVGNELFLAMELIEGINLRDAALAATRRRSRPSIAMCCYILAEVASGLDYAHRRKDDSGKPLGIVHCDVSPQNVALSWEGYVKILDFGVARATFVAAEKGRLRGKPRYMSPEQTRGDIPTAATDVFALGVVAWELLCGAPLFDGPDVESILRAIQRLDVIDPCSIEPEIPAHLGRAIVRALSREPTARGLASDLAAAFTLAQRELDPQLGARNLSRWLAEMFPESPVNSPLVEEPRPTPMPVPPLPQSTAAREAVGPAPGSGSYTPTVPGVPDASQPTLVPSSSTAPSASVEGSNTASMVGLEAPEPDVLDEKRRMVAVACLLEGGTPEQRQLAERVVADVAYKHGAGVRPEGAGLGQQVVALFGMELHGDDDVADALRFVAAAHEAVREERLSLRAGVRQGVARTRRGGYALLGDVLDEAVALAQAAPSGRTYFGGVPGRQAAHGFAFRELGPMRRRGRRMRVHEVVVAHPSERPLPMGPLIGRGRELAGLVDAWRGAVLGDTHAACALVGEPGIGKTRLANELSVRVAAEHGEVLFLSALPGARETPYAAAIELFHLELGLATMRGPAGRVRLCNRLQHEFETAGRDADEHLRAVVQALELSSGVAPPPEAQATLRERVAAALVALRSLREAAPRLVVVDDWHWLDVASAEVLILLLTTPAPGAQLTVVTARPGVGGESPHWPPTVSPVIRLGELSRADALALIRDRLTPGAGEEDVALIELRAGGNPLFIEELCGALGELAPGEMPESARSVIAARVDRLPRGAKAALQHAAVVGPVFNARLLEELLGPSVRRGLIILEQAGIVARKKGEQDLSFRHLLLQEVVYDSLSGAARREAHRRIGTLLSEHFEAGRVKMPEAIARHLELGGDAPRAAIFYLRAGKLDLAAGGDAAAMHAFTRAIDLGLGAADRERDARFGRERAAGHLGDTATQRQDLDALMRLCAGDERRLTEVHARAARLWLRQGELLAALASADSAERGAERLADQRTRAGVLRVRAEVLQRLGQPDRALDAARKALEMQLRAGARDDEARTMVVAGRVHLMTLELDAALGCYRPALSRARAGGDHWLERRILTHLAAAHLLRGELGESMTVAQQALELARRSGDRGREGDSAAVIGSLLIELGHLDDGRAWLERALEIFHETGARLARGDTLIVAGRLEVHAGDLPRAFAFLEEAVATAQTGGARHPVALGKTELALALVRRRGPGDLARAERHAEEAVAVAREARLQGVEILALSRAALALFEGGDARAAVAPCSHALHLADRARATEGSEEELWFTQYRILDALRDPGAATALDRANAVITTKVAGLAPDWRPGFESTELRRQIRHAVARGR